jgi:hypothetical protein
MQRCQVLRHTAVASHDTCATFLNGISETPFREVAHLPTGRTDTQALRGGKEHRTTFATPITNRS